MASDLSLDEYVAREERYERTGKLDSAPSAAGPVPPPPIPGQLPSPPIGSPGQLSYLDEFRSGQRSQPSIGNIFPGAIASIDEAAQQLKGQSKEDWAKLGISIALGEEGEPSWYKNPPQPVAIPKSIWDTLEVTNKATPKTGGEVRTDGSGNFFQHAGDHKVMDPQTGEVDHHVVANQVASDAEREQFMKDYPALGSDAGMDAFSEAQKHGLSFDEAMKLAQKAHLPNAVGPEPGSPEWFKAKSDAFQKKNFPDSPEAKDIERKDQLKNAQADYLESLKNGPHSEDDAAAWKHYIEEELGGTLPITPKEAQDMQAYMDSLKNKPKMQPEENFPNWNESHALKESKFDDAGHVDTLREYATRNNLSAEEYHKLLDASLASSNPPPPLNLSPGEDVGPVDWNWYKPQGGSNPPFEPPYSDQGGFPMPPHWQQPERFLWKPQSDTPFDVPPGWDIAKEDMGPRSSDFWERFNWEPPPGGLINELPPELRDILQPPPEDPNSPDFPGPNRWDYKPPPD